jgi:hypothetical protein
MARAGGGFHWEGDLQAKLNQFGPKIKRNMVAAAKYTAGQAESYMKSEAPWTDRSGAARNGLGTEVVVSTNKVAIVLYQSVEYGPFLEVRWGGKYAIIEPTMAAAGPIFLEALARMIFDD